MVARAGETGTCKASAAKVFKRLFSYCFALQVGKPHDLPPPMPYSDEDPGDEVVHHDITDAANKASPTNEDIEEVVT